MSDTQIAAAENPETTGQKTGSGGAARIDGLKTYDFKHPKLVSKEVIRALRNIHEQLSRNLNRIFTDFLNKKTDVILVDIDELIFSEFLSRLEAPTALFMFNIEELGDWALLEMDPSFCLYCIERQGGSREENIKPPRALTRIEERITGRIVDKVFKELSHVWSPYLNITILNHVYESKPANVRTMSSHIPGIIVRYEIQAEEIKVPFRICYPYALLKERMNQSFYKSDKSSGRSGLSEQQQTAFENYLKEVNVPLSVILGRVNISMQELVGMEEGDVIPLGQAIDEPLDILINGIPKLAGYPGNMGGKRAVKVFEIKDSLK